MKYRSSLALACVVLASACTTQSIAPLDGGRRPDSQVVEPDAGPPCDNGVRDGDESHIDCGGSCDACPSGANCVQPSDCESGVCARGFCLEPSCSDLVRNGLEIGVDCGADCGLCPGGQPCTSNDDCVSGRCRASTCEPSSCEDGRMNGDETGTDCGGPECPACGGGSACRTDDDCDSFICEGGLCEPATCSDRVQNQDETSLDCGGVVCPRCRDGLACLIDPDCIGMRCFAGQCVSCDDDIRNAEETDVDCGGPLCTDCPDGDACVLDGDCASGRCLDGACISCSDGAQNADETDVDCGGSVCGGCADRRACVIAADCTSGRCDVASSTCISCSDRLQNADETDVDCGGALCPGCAPGLMCLGDGDCASNICASTGLCNAPGCGDSVLNGAETDLDCGGGSCLGCMVGQTCILGRDCESGVCTGGTCQAATCTDGVVNGGETDIDCGGATACPRCADRRRCGDPTDCSSAACTRNRCGLFAGCHWGLIAQESQFSNLAIQRLFDDNGHTYDVLNLNGTAGVHSASMTTLDMYTHVILHEHDRVLTSAEQANLRRWIDAGGRLIVTGYDSLGSPSDSVLASIVNCTGPGDGPFTSALTVTSATHRILAGPAQVFTAGMSLTAGSTDHDTCTPAAGAVSLVTVSSASKLFITEGIGGGRGAVVYWNGNGSGSSELYDWAGTSGTQPALQNLFVNVLDHLCTAP